MNWKVLLNILLVVLLLHFILKNLQYAYNNKHGGLEYFTNNKKEIKEIKELKERRLPAPGPPLVKIPPENLNEPVQTVNMNKEHFNAIEFLTTPEQNYDNIFYLNKETDKVKQANVYTNDWNVPNFQSNVMDLRNFFKTNPNPEKPIHRDLDLQPASTSQIDDQACFIDNSNASAKTTQPDIWKYKNELPMNGGSFLQNVYGYDNGNNLFATFDPKNTTNTQNCKPNNTCNSCPDDIRNGIGVPGRKWWSRN